MVSSPKMKIVYSNIQQKLYYMIPEKWEKIYLYASIFEGINNVETGEMFFYYFPKGILKRKPINVYEIPNEFNIEEKEYYKLADDLYKEVKTLKKAFIEENHSKWTNVTISIENSKFTVEYNYENLKSSKYNSYERHLIWRYKYLKADINSYNRKERNIILEYMENEEENIKKDIFSEGIYRDKMHNIINYDKEEKQEELSFIEENEEKVNKTNQILRY